MSRLTTTSRDLHLNAKGYAIVARLFDHDGIDPGEASELPWRVSMFDPSLDIGVVETFYRARSAVERMTPKARALAAGRGRALTSNIIRRAIPGKEWAFIP